ncbi:MAG: outer membrane protein assembly factor BamA [Spirochaetia bacterium]|nr:outer membrane protein assembly factor BamA [Spirochaetota bacterium]MDW8112171.1 outer membrane protein assembly factor BamA [Spirochaetia bacterium]
MRRVLVIFLLKVIFAAYIFSSPITNLSDIQGYKINKIVFSQMSRQAENLLRDNITLKEGDFLDLDKVIQMTKDIYRLSILYEFSIDYAIVDRDKKLLDIYIVGKEADVIDEVKINGNKSLSSDDIKEVLFINKGDYVSEYKIYSSIFAIRQKYREEGLLDATVRHSFSRENNKLILNFDIDEGPRSIVKKITFSGISNINEGDLKGIMDTKEEVKFIGIPIVRGYFDPDKFSKDIDKIKYFYDTKGFIESKISFTNIVVSNHYDNQTNLIEKHIYITIGIEEGQKYYFGSIEIKGDIKVFSTNEILKKFKLLKGDVFAMDQVDKWIYSVSRMYWDRGYIFTRVDKKLKKNESIRFIDIEVEIQEGDIGHIGSILVVGNTYTKTYVIERELDVKEGEIFTVYKLQRSVERLNMTQYFEKVEWEVKEGEAEGIMDLIFKVKEGRTGIISLSAGYGSVSGFTLGGSISHINLFGTGKKIQGKVDIGQNQQGINLSFTEPYLFDSLFSLSTSIYFYNTLVRDIIVDDDSNGIPESTNGTYWQTKLGLGLNVGRRLGSYYNVGVGYSIYSTITHNKSFINPYDASVSKELSLTYVDNWWEVYRGKLKSILSLSFSFDSRNNPLVPSKGVNGGLYLDYVGHLIGGFFEFIKLTGSFSFYQAIPITEEYSLVWVLYTTHGAMFPQLSGRLEFEIMDLFWFDGYYELRGWGGYGIRGRAKSFFSTELRIPIIGNELWGTLFGDLGNAFPRPEDYNFDLNRYYGSFGIGAMINIPGFPIRIYLARQFRFQDNTPRLYLSDQFFNNWQFVFAIQGLF